MNKTINITLHGQLFALEDDAYSTLKKYLEDVEHHLSASDDKKEIINDIECSIAEKFSGKLVKGKEVINLGDIQEILEIMGKPEEISDEEDEPVSEDKKDDETEKEKNSNRQKKLYRNTEDKIIAGVASGIAAYFGIDPVIVRLIFVATVFLNGTGIIAYLVLWAIVPPAVSLNQKMEMEGELVTLKKIEEFVKEKSEKFRSKKIRKEGLENVVEMPFNFIKEVFRMFGQVISKVIPALMSLVGIAIMLGSVFAIAGILFLSSALTFLPGSNIISSEFPIQEIISGWPYVLSVLSLTIFVLVPILIIFSIGAALVRKKFVMSSIFIVTLIVMWMFSVAITGGLAVNYLPKINEEVKRFENSGGFNKDFDIKIEGVGKVFYHGATEQLSTSTIEMEKEAGIDFEKEDLSDWKNLVDMIKDCKVVSVSQNHAQEVTIELKDGSRINAIEPNIDDVFSVVDEAEEKCGRIMMATE